MSDDLGLSKGAVAALVAMPAILIVIGAAVVMRPASARVEVSEVAPGDPGTVSLPPLGPPPAAAPIISASRGVSMSQAIAGLGTGFRWEKSPGGNTVWFKMDNGEDASVVSHGDVEDLRDVGVVVPVRLAGGKAAGELAAEVAVRFFRNVAPSFDPTNLMHDAAVGVTAESRGTAKTERFYGSNFQVGFLPVTNDFGFILIAKAEFPRH